jgi:hypothetical protein
MSLRPAYCFPLQEIGWHFVAVGIAGCAKQIISNRAVGEQDQAGDRLVAHFGQQQGDAFRAEELEDGAKVVQAVDAEALALGDFISAGMAGPAPSYRTPLRSQLDAVAFSVSWQPE